MTGPAAKALERLKAGGLVAFPTETVWGLAAQAESAAALAHLREWKGRGEDRPVALLVSAADVLLDLDFELSDAADALTSEFWPGALTLVLPCRHRFAQGVARADGAVGVRCSSHPVAADLARQAEAAGVGPLTATSLNRSGDPPARCLAEAAKLCGQAAAEPMLLATDTDAGGEPPSTVVDLTGRFPVVLRGGALETEVSQCLATRGLSS